jgi:hypothetical protein
MRNEYDQTEPDYGSQQQFDTPPTNAKLENAPLLDLHAGPVTMARLLALVERKARMNAVVARKPHRTAFVGHWGKV